MLQYCLPVKGSCRYDFYIPASCDNQSDGSQMGYVPLCRNAVSCLPVSNLRLVWCSCYRRTARPQLFFTFIGLAQTRAQYLRETKNRGCIISLPSSCYTNARNEKKLGQRVPMGNKFVKTCSLFLLPYFLQVALIAGESQICNFPCFDCRQF